MATIERLIASTAQGDLLGGLFWRAPSAGQGRGRALVEARALTSDATHWAQAQVGVHVRYGLFQPRASEEGVDRKSTRLNSSHLPTSRMPSSA